MRTSCMLQFSCTSGYDIHQERATCADVSANMTSCPICLSQCQHERDGPAHLHQLHRHWSSWALSTFWIGCLVRAVLMTHRGRAEVLSATPNAAQLALRGCCGPTRGCPASRGCQAVRQTAPARCVAPLTALHCPSAAPRTSCGPCHHRPPTAHCCRVTDSAGHCRSWTRWPCRCCRLRMVSHSDLWLVIVGICIHARRPKLSDKSAIIPRIKHLTAGP